METTLTSNKSLLAWLDEKVELTKPSKIVWIDGSKEQIDALKAEAVETGEMIKLNEELLPDCYLHRTAENDVARVEDRTLICSKKEEDAGPTNHWMEPSKAYKMLYDIAAGAYEGRTMVYHSLFHGSRWFSLLQGRYRDHRFYLRCAEHEHHDQSGQGCSGCTGRL